MNRRALFQGPFAGALVPPKDILGAWADYVDDMDSRRWFRRFRRRKSSAAPAVQFTRLPWDEVQWEFTPDPLFFGEPEVLTHADDGQLTFDWGD